MNDSFADLRSIIENADSDDVTVNVDSVKNLLKEYDKLNNDGSVLTSELPVVKNTFDWAGSW